MLLATGGGFGMYLVVTIISIWHASFGLFACLDFVLCPFVSFFSPFLGCFHFMKFGRVSSNSISFDICLFLFVVFSSLMPCTQFLDSYYEHFEPYSSIKHSHG
jgi:hypothetical protein